MVVPIKKITFCGFPNGYMWTDEVFYRYSCAVCSMVLLSDGNSEIGAHVGEQTLLFDLLKAFDDLPRLPCKL